MRTTHRVIAGDARALSLAPGSVHLVVTSPPYPMIAMWDSVFSTMDPAIAALLETDPAAAFEAQHRALDDVWRACWTALAPGGWMCVNIGDATRTLGGEFRLWPNHARILDACTRIGFSILPDILWRKPTNAPNKFMGSGMLPAGAYVTFEHEYVLVMRKGAGRTFTDAEKRVRRESAYFWEERNQWFSDVWTDLVGTNQRMSRQTSLFGGDAPGRDRSAAFPLDLPWRLVLMYSVYGDLVLDPFAGTGTTLLAAACAGRSSIGVECDPALATSALDAVLAAPEAGRARQAGRLAAHRRFVEARAADGKPVGHHNGPHDVPVMTGQEAELVLRVPAHMERTGDACVSEHVTLGTGKGASDSS